MLYALLRTLGQTFRLKDVSDDMVYGAVDALVGKGADWAVELHDELLGSEGIADVRIRIIGVLYLIGAVSIRLPSKGIRSSWDDTELVSEEMLFEALENGQLRVHPMLWNCLGLQER